jgi:glycosyltransferase involved in cell wall biosynthesis
MNKLSVIVITYNEEQNIERCLRSVRWADEVILVDSFSTDRTVEIAKDYTTGIIQHQYNSDILQREHGFAAATGDWFFWIDADEGVSDELKSNILHVINSSNSSDGYYVARKACVFKKWIEHGGWFPDWQFRLVKRDKVVPEYQEVHGGFTTHGSKGYLPGLLYHFTYSTISEHLRKMNDQTSLHVSNKLRENPKIIVKWYKILLSPISYFLRMFIGKKGYKDGMPGFILACNSALYTLLVYSKTWEYQYRKKEGKGFLPPITNLDIRQTKQIRTFSQQSGSI